MIVDCAHYRAGVRQHEEALGIEDAARIAAAAVEGEFVWLGLRDPSDAELDLAQRDFDLNPLAVEDAKETHQRPKLEDYDGSYFVVLKTAHYDDDREEIDFGEINLFIGAGYLIAIRHGRGDLAPARDRLESRPELVDIGPAAAAWAILDKVVDDYEPVAAGIDNDIAEVENEVFASRDVDATQRIYFLRREVIEFHRAVQPLVGPLESLETGVAIELDDQIRRYFRDVADHARRIDEQLHDQRDLLTGALDANLSLITLRQNEVVRAISAWAAIIALPTFIASVYGMNFRYMPELDLKLGYPLALLAMVLVVLAMYRFFKRIRWL